MSQAPTKRKPSKRSDLKEKKERTEKSWRPLIIAGCVCVLVLAILYPVGHDYYHAMRNEQRVQAQLAAVNARNDAVKAENEALQTDEGIENQARADMGWVKEGENAGVVTNSEGTVDSVSRLPDHLDVASIKAPQTWYYAILDTIFFYHE